MASSGCDGQHQALKLSKVDGPEHEYEIDPAMSSIESLEGDADDEEFSDEKKSAWSSDSEPGYYSLPATPPRIRNKKDYASENEVEKCDSRKRRIERLDHYIYNTAGKENKKSGGVMLIARPKGGRRSLRMDIEEVRACRDLGFELEMPSRLPISTSPIAHWRISSPGDNPRDVKARLKIWAHAVALASTSRPTA